MIEHLRNLWFKDKEISVYMYLVEYWVSAASEISKNLNIAKSTINFLADSLRKKWILKKSFKQKTWFYEADIDDLENVYKQEMQKKEEALGKIIPILKEKNKNIFSKPKIIFIDWVENCKKAYLDLLKIKWWFIEFWAHEDLENAFSKKFMNDFIRKRVEKDIFCHAIWNNSEVEKLLREKDSKELRSIKIFPKEFWEVNSSIVVYENKILILNLKWVYSWVLIESKELSQTMKTIFNICKSR